MRSASTRRFKKRRSRSCRARVSEAVLRRLPYAADSFRVFTCSRACFRSTIRHAGAIMCVFLLVIKAFCCCVFVCVCVGVIILCGEIGVDFVVAETESVRRNDATEKA